MLEAYRDGIEEWLLAPAWSGVDDPVERIFALLNAYRTMLVTSDCTYGCPIGSLALELHEPDPAIRELLAANFENWTVAIHRCLDAAGERLPASVDRRRLAEFVLTVMEGAVMQARTYRDIGYFDRNIAMLRDQFDLMVREARRGWSSPEGTARDAEEAETLTSIIWRWCLRLCRPSSSAACGTRLAVREALGGG